MVNVYRVCNVNAQCVLFLYNFSKQICAYIQKQYLDEKPLDKAQYIVVKLIGNKMHTTYCFNIENLTGGNYERNYCY